MNDSDIGLDPIAHNRVQVCRVLIKERKRIGVHLGFALCPVPAWDMLLDLYLAFHQSRAINIWSLCLAANIPSSTAHRKIGEMVDEGIFQRGTEGGRVMVNLTAEYIQKLDSLFDDLAGTLLEDDIVSEASRNPPGSNDLSADGPDGS
ncbi:MAG: MarR-family transcriptional regulator [Novosphingobium sp.]|nr:MarR-family transcriptional regulator [Novosphingobium sp.]